MTQLLNGSCLRKLGSALLIIGICLMTAATSQAVTLYWNAPAGGTGAWDVTNMTWLTLTTGPVDTIWSNAANNDAVFEDTAGTVTIDAGGITAQSLTFNTAGYVIDGGTLTLAGTTPTVTAASNATINAAIDGSLGLVKAGGAVLTLGGNNTFSGDVTISAGTLAVSNSNNLGSAANNIIFNGGTLRTLAALAAETRNITMTGTGTIDTNGFDSAFSGVISGTGA